jgi:hypothetical protein
VEAEGGEAVTIDYRALLAKYIGYVTDCEGTDFIEDGQRGYSGDVSFTPEEWAALQAMLPEAQAARDAAYEEYKRKKEASR